MMLVVFSACNVHQSTGSAKPDQNEACPRDLPSRYDILLDAGSTGTRIHIFEYNSKQLLRETFDSVTPGLSHFARGDPGGAGKSIRKLMETALNAVPASHYQCTRVALKATAGLRLLPLEKSEGVLREVERTLRKYPFVLDSVSIMSGEEEGVGAWLTVAYLLGLAEGPATGSNSTTLRTGVAVFDVGGASAQVVFPVPSGYKGKEQQISHLRYGGEDTLLFRYSFLGLGINQAILRVLLRLQPDERSVFSCLPSGYRHFVQWGGEAPFVVENVDGKMQEFGACLSHFNSFFKELPSDQLTVIEQMRSLMRLRSSSGPIDMFGLSFFHHLLWRFNKSEVVTVKRYRELGELTCSASARQDRATTCMDLAYLYSFLSTLLGLNDDTTLNVPDKLRSVKASWALGASLLSAAAKLVR
uniref:WGS project CAEQ00000000 data, annotated contig 1439 n=1 Tax=Trypanosoma congolense (strain IL3000) TaxID=1068625 RepID=F9W696_TRYCI|nr:unnamed protein product [Trypanosoma congolense IL3000]